MRAQSKKTVLMMSIILASYVQAGRAQADVIRDFGLQEQVTTYGAPGTISVNTTTGVIVGVSIFPVEFVGNQARYPSFTQGYSSSARAYELDVVSAIQTAQATIYFDTPSLVGYDGGYLGSVAHPTPGGAISKFNSVLVTPGILLDGSAFPVTPLNVDVPEPSSLALLAFATISAIGGALRQRKQQCQEVLSQLCLTIDA